MRATVPTVEAGVASAHLAPPLDQHDAELAVVAQHLLGHQPVSGLEHVQRQHRVREQHGAQREHRHHAARAHLDSVQPGAQRAGADPQLGRRVLAGVRRVGPARLDPIGEPARTPLPRASRRRSPTSWSASSSCSLKRDARYRQVEHRTSTRVARDRSRACRVRGWRASGRRSRAVASARGNAS